MEKLTIATGEKEYSLNDKCTVTFSPSDPNFAERLYSAFDDLKKKHETMRDAESVEKMTSREKFDYLKALDAEMRETIDGVFQKPVCDALFPAVSMYAAADGAPVWMNLILAIMDELDEGVKREKVFHSEKLVKYTKRYAK